MKRSEMIRFLSRRLICPHVVLHEGIENHYVQKAESLLHGLEKLGMLPPITIKIRPVTSVTMMTMGDEMVSVNEWDKE